MIQPDNPHPCQVGANDFDHDFEYKDYSFDHELGTEKIVYSECTRCGIRFTDGETD